MSVTEELREALLDLEEARKMEALQRQTAEALLKGLQVLTLAWNSNQIFPQLFDVLRDPLDFHAAFVVAASENGFLVPIAMSDARFGKTIWKSGPTFQRAMKGHTLAIFNTAEVEEWQNQAEALRKEDRSALIFFIGSNVRPALFVCTHPERAHFSRRHVNLAHRFSILAAQALIRFDADQRVTLLEQQLEAESRVAELNRKLAESEKQLAQAQKMESIGILAGGIAHDFNNLLHAMGGNLELLDMKIPEDHPGKKRVKTIQKSMDRAAHLVRQMLIFSRKTEIQRQSHDLNREIRDVRNMLERSIPKMVNIELILDDNAWPINADPVQVEQVLLNMGTNAADAMYEGGRLIIETANVALDQDFIRTHTGAKPGKYVLMTVSDTGCGMDKEALQHVFDPFFTTKEVGKGTGLGLASVYGIVKAHEGYIYCYSEPGKGTTFKIYWPAAEPGNIEPVEKQAEQVALQDVAETILVVDDDDQIRELTRELLEETGYQVLSAASGEQALEIFKKQPGEIDLVLMDLNMPGMGGGECTRQMLSIDPSVKVLVASGYSAHGHGNKALGLGAKDFISKPYQMREILAKIREVLDK